MYIKKKIFNREYKVASFFLSLSKLNNNARLSRCDIGATQHYGNIEINPTVAYTTIYIQLGSVRASDVSFLEAVEI